MNRLSIFTTLWVTRPLFLVLLLSLFSLSPVFAQESPPVSPVTPVSGANPEAVADEAVQAWLETPSPELLSLAQLSPDELCTQLPVLLQNPPPAAGTTVNLADRRELEEADPNTRRYSYPASLPNDQLSVVEVTLQKQGDVWRAEGVGFRTAAATVSIPDALQTRTAGWIFALLSLALLYALVRPTFMRRWLEEGWGVLRAHRRLVIGTVVGLYGLFALGVLLGTNLPASCDRAILGLVEASLEGLGATQAYGSGDVARAAAVTFYQNFFFGAFITSFGSAFLFGIPAYFLNGARFFAVGVPFGLVGGAGPLALLFILGLLLIELMAYVLVTAGGGIFLVTLIRKGFSGYREGFRALLLMLPIALVLLVLGAWYEAAGVILGG